MGDSVLFLHTLGLWAQCRQGSLWLMWAAHRPIWDFVTDLTGSLTHQVPQRGPVASGRHSVGPLTRLELEGAFDSRDLPRPSPRWALLCAPLTPSPASSRPPPCLFLLLLPLVASDRFSLLLFNCRRDSCKH